MVETKNKLVTVDAVKELHDYSENSYVKYDYISEQIQSEMSKFAPKLESYPLPLIEAETDGQTEFVIDLDTFDATTDTVLVLSGRTYLHQNSDYTIIGNKIVLTEGVPAGRTVAIIVMRIVV